MAHSKRNKTEEFEANNRSRQIVIIVTYRSYSSSSSSFSLLLVLRHTTSKCGVGAPLLFLNCRHERGNEGGHPARALGAGATDAAVLVGKVVVGSWLSLLTEMTERLAAQ